MAEQCFIIVQSLNLVPTSLANNTWPTFSFNRTCGNRGCWRVFDFGKGDVRVAKEAETLRCETFVGKREWQTPVLLPWDEAFESGFRECEGCGLVRYCSEECRREDGESHVNFCKMVVGRREGVGLVGGGKSVRLLL